ncbi:MAG: hypothetical protein RML72_12280 [Bacteroidia bacterium]|nr:hypothetical protein [Bacteroidia bacterium]MDW8159635.1 hypothetical protein [Bacteroidia bacterium]
MANNNIYLFWEEAFENSSMPLAPKRVQSIDSLKASYFASVLNIAPNSKQEALKLVSEGIKNSSFLLNLLSNFVVSPLILNSEAEIEEEEELEEEDYDFEDDIDEEEDEDWLDEEFEDDNFDDEDWDDEDWEDEEEEDWDDEDWEDEEDWEDIDDIEEEEEENKEK